jgi:hypothetical protein
LFGGGTCHAILELHRSERAEVEFDDATGKLEITPDALDLAENKKNTAALAVPQTVR